MNGSKLVGNTLLNLIGFILPLFVGIVTIPFIIRGLGTHRFGILSLAWAVLIYLSLFDLGLGRATIKFISESLGNKEYKKIPSIFWTSLLFNSLLGIVGGIALAVSTPILINNIFNIPSYLLREAQTSFLILAALVPAVVSSTSLRGVLEGAQRFDLVNIVKASSSALNFLIPALAIPFGLHLPEIIFFLLVARIGTASIYLIFCFKVFPALRKNISLEKKLVRPLFTFGGWVTVSNVTGPILIYLDRFLIGSLLTIAAVTFYTAPYEIVSRLWIFPTSLMMSLFPAFSSLGNNHKEKLGNIYAYGLKYLLLVMGPLILIFVLFAKDILNLWIGAEFALKSTLVLQILGIYVLISSLAYIPFTLIQGVGRPDIPAKFHLLELPIFIVIAWLLIKKFGIVGAALATSFRIIMDAILLFGASWKLVPSTFPALARNRIVRTIIALLGLTSISISLVILFNRLLNQIIALGVIISFFIVVVWNFILDSEEKRFLSSALRLILKRSR